MITDIDHYLKGTMVRHRTKIKGDGIGSRVKRQIKREKNVQKVKNQKSTKNKF